MAEIRKHKQTNSQIAQAIEQAMGAAVRPTTPGAPPEPTRRPQPQQGAAPTVGTSFATGVPAAGTAGSGGWASLQVDRLLAAQQARRADEQAAADPDGDDLIEEDRHHRDH